MVAHLRKRDQSVAVEKFEQFSSKMCDESVVTPACNCSKNIGNDCTFYCNAESYHTFLQTPLGAWFISTPFTGDYTFCHVMNTSCVRPIACTWKLIVGSFQAKRALGVKSSNLLEAQIYLTHPFRELVHCG